MKNLSILAIKYSEPEYQQTAASIAATGLPVIWVERDPVGVGSLAEAINRGMKKVKTEFVLVVTNIVFSPETPKRLLENISDAVAVHPVFESDHPHLRKGEGVGIIPFCEFTAPLINKSKWLALDEDMPYWGHDLDFGYRVYQTGGKILCDYTTRIEHTYIRNSGYNPIRADRLRRRRETDNATRNALRRKYGEQWKGVTWHKSEKEIGSFYEQVKQKCFV